MRKHRDWAQSSRILTSAAALALIITGIGATSGVAQAAPADALDQIVIANTADIRGNVYLPNQIVRNAL